MLRDVRWRCDDAPLKGFARVLGRSFRIVTSQIGDNDLGASFREGVDDGATNSARAAGDDDRFVSEISDGVHGLSFGNCERYRADTWNRRAAKARSKRPASTVLGKLNLRCE